MCKEKKAFFEIRRKRYPHYGAVAFGHHGKAIYLDI